MARVERKETVRQSRAGRVEPAPMAGLAIAAYVLCGATAWAQQLTLEIKDYATIPITGSTEKSNNNVAGLLARINFLRDEPGGGKRFFVNDLMGRYISWISRLRRSQPI